MCKGQGGSTPSVLCSNVDYLYIDAFKDHPAWHYYIDSTEWLAFFCLFPTVKMLHI